MEIILYAIFISLTFFLSVVSPIIIGNTIKKSEKNAKILSRGTLWLFKKLGAASIIFEWVFILVNRLIKKIFRFEDEDESFLAMINVMITIGIVTALYYFFSYQNLTTVCIELRSVIIENLGKGIDLKSIIELFLDNGLLIISFLKIDGWYIKLFIQIILSILYVAIIFYGVENIKQLNNKNSNGKVYFKLGLIKSITLINVIKTSIVIAVGLFILSLGTSVDGIALTLLVLNVFNIEISLGTAVVALTPIVAEKAYVKFTSRKLEPLKDSHVWGR
ncbi:hypothetical protein J1C67_14595 [Clostridium gasigenes]|uniref:hypothetical protein n=1 Tax=Clostridium gasigenes TaxID=94869 RepID=UPI0014382EF2|nr:hypothetical protein [Clostridium gasigenes]NKF05312.1 hypothetical protein [Clostridium gasigenes]QSW18765.1 hypothetical protein J1C67_14595 [Clostridium gasigenes]